MKVNLIFLSNLNKLKRQPEWKTPRLSQIELIDYYIQPNLLSLVSNLQKLIHDKRIQQYQFFQLKLYQQNDLKLFSNNYISNQTYLENNIIYGINKY